MILGNARILVENSSLKKDMGILIENGTIIEIGDTHTLRQKHNVEFYDCRNRIVMPGLVCAHTHTYSAFARGMPVKTPLTDFLHILKNLWWKLDSVLDREAVEYSAWVSFIEGVKHGTTTYFDHHASPQYIANSLETIGDVAKKVGIRANLSYEITDRYGEEKAIEAIKENEKFVKLNRSQMLTGMIGLHASFTLSDETLAKVKEIKKNTESGIHIHVAEDVVDEKYTIEKYGCDVVSRLEKFELLDEKSLCVHCIHLSDAEIEKLAAREANIVHCAASNMNNAVGWSKIPLFLSRDMPVFLGTDGFTHDMFTEAKVCHILHKFATGKTTEMPASKAFELLAANAKLAQKFFGVNLGKIAEGYAADLVLIDYKNYTPLNSLNFPWHFVFGMDATQVTDVLVNGRFLVKDRKLWFDENPIIEKSIKISEQIWEKFEKVNT
ncbi:MAG: putative aminohydrolase SsnA [Thermoplasmata archaeon]